MLSKNWSESGKQLNSKGAAIFIAPAYSKVRNRGSNFCMFVRTSVHNLCQGAYSVAVIAGSMKPCIVITLDTHFKKAP